MSTSTISRNGNARRSAASLGEARPDALENARRSRARDARPAEWRRPLGAPSGAAGTGARVSMAGHHHQGSAAAMPNTWALSLAAAVLLLVGGAAIAVRGMGVVDTSTTIGIVQVQPGDTLGSIAARNAPGLAVGDVVGQIRALNDIPSTRVQVGQRLRVPVTAGR